jgi:hypothetical protein
MGAAEGISFEEVRASKQWDTLRQQLHERFDQWIDTLEQQLHEPPSTFTEVTATVWDLRQQRTGGITETIVAPVHRGAHDRKLVNCPRCEGVVRARERVCRTVETLGGPVQLERPYFSGRPCRVGRYPFDAALGVVAGCTQLDRQKAAANLVMEVPYDTAQALFRDLTGVPFGSERMHTVTNQVAEPLTVLDVAPSREEIKRRVAEVAVGRWRRPVVVLGIDGASVPTRPDSAREPQEGQGRKRAKRGRGQWRDAKGVRFSLIDGDRIVPLLSWHQGQNEEQVGEALAQGKAAGVIPEAAVCGQGGSGPRRVVPDAGAVTRSDQSDGALLGVSRCAPRPNRLQKAASRGISIGQWGDRIVQQVHLSCAAEALGGLVV